MARSSLTLDELVAGVTAYDRAVLAQAITLVESIRPEDEVLAQELLDRLLPRAGGAWRVGVSGAPGVGKSTFIEALGKRLVERGERVAVLAVDPSSTISGGSILGDKSRMVELSRAEGAFIRPSPTAETLGGVARRTRETIRVCEAAGCGVVLVETVGVGQSETLVAGMVDVFLVLVLPGAGDELQGIKKGILELADVVAVNKADGPQLAAAREAVRTYTAAFSYSRARRRGGTPRALAVSARTGEGLEELWRLVLDHRRSLEETGELQARWRAELRTWMWSLVEERVLRAFRTDPAVRATLAGAERELLAGRITAGRAADLLLAAFAARRT
ncbi:MAG: methylmalonyl Co-A mutase-associated GTPase MeaB [Planctomycetota bacterium]